MRRFYSENSDSELRDFAEWCHLCSLAERVHVCGWHSAAETLHCISKAHARLTASDEDKKTQSTELGMLSNREWQ
eukprot:SAG31_NODE_1886_length_6989_cov_6.914514_6_plen_75_part_00